jgi:uncharacterized protein YceK
MIGSMVLAVVFAFALDGCSRVATRIKPHTAPAAAAAGERPHSAIAAIAG